MVDQFSYVIARAEQCHSTQGGSEAGEDSEARLADRLAAADRRSEEMGLQMQALANQMNTLMQVVSAMAGTTGTDVAQKATPGAPTGSHATRRT